ncbi:MAG: hypothetical protein OHK0032_19160 [Thermodesulfovibrionales bacterium]
MSFGFFISSMRLSSRTKGEWRIFEYASGTSRRAKRNAGTPQKVFDFLGTLERSLRNARILSLARTVIPLWIRPSILCSAG